MADDAAFQFEDRSPLMINKGDQRRLSVQYLLGDLADADRAEFEDLYLNDSDIFQELVTAENEMVDRYLSGQLSRTEREKFEHVYMRDPARRETVEAARSLLAYSAAESAAASQLSEPEAIGWHRGWVATLAAAAALVLIAAVSWLVLINRRLEHDLQRLRQEQETLLHDKEALQGQADQLRADLHQMEELSGPDTVSFTLGAGTSRATDEAVKLVIPADASYILFRVALEGKALPRYSLSVRTLEGNLIWRKDNIQATAIPTGTEVAAKMPSRLLRRNGDYVIRVTSGGDDLSHTLAGYSFHTVKR